MNYRRPYTLFKKKLSSGSKIWYYIVYDSNDKRHQYSTGSKIKAQAIKYCLSLFKNDNLRPKEKEELNVVPTFKEYTKNWSIYDKCPYIQERLACGFTITKCYADRRRGEFEKYILPFFGNYKIDKIDRNLLLKWVLHLKKDLKLSNSTTNKITKGLKVIFSFAYKKGVLKTDIGKSIQLLKNDTKTHGCFEKSEIDRLFDKTRIGEIWKNDVVQYTLNYTASKTGMRRGEIQGLQKENIFKDHILVEHTWLHGYGLKDTKTHKSREIPISPELYILLSTVAKSQTKGHFVFSHTEGKTPIESSRISKYFKEALVKIGISESEQKDRFLSFHSYRHYVNTMLVKSGIPISIVQSIIGHINDDKMTEYYTHIRLEDQKVALDYL